MRLTCTAVAMSLVVDFLFAFAANAEALTYAVVSDVQTPTKSARLVRKSIQRSGIKNLVMAGDQLDNSWSGHKDLTYSDIWRPWLDAGFIFDVVAHGNHYLSKKKEQKYFGMPGPYYSVVNGPARFIVLNSNSVKTASEQALWLENQLVENQESFVFVVFHHFPYTISKTHAWEDRKGFHLKIRPLIFANKDKITALFVGHDHISAFYEMGGLPVILSAATAEPRRGKPFDYAVDGVRIKPHWFYKGDPGWTKMDIDSVTNSVWFDFIDAKTDKVSCTVQLQDKKILLQENCSIRSAKT